MHPSRHPAPAPAGVPRAPGSVSGACPAASRFPLATALSSTTSAAGPPALFGGFSGTMAMSDFPSPCIIGVRPWTFRCGLRRDCPQTMAGSPGSRARCVRACAGSATAPGPAVSRAGETSGVAFRLAPRRRHLGSWFFRGSMAGLHVPLSTLRLHPYGWRRMTRSRCGSLLLPPYDSCIHNILPVFPALPERAIEMTRAAGLNSAPCSNTPGCGAR